MVQCPVCKGDKKQIFSSSRVGRRGAKIFSVVEVACPLCKGIGTVTYKIEKQFFLSNSEEI